MNEYKNLKRKYGENFAKFCRENFSTILEQEGLLSEILESKFTPSHYLFEDIVSQKKQLRFKDYIMGLYLQKQGKNLASLKKQYVPSPYELMAKAGYDLFHCETNSDVLSFKKYWRDKESLCTFRNPTRINRYHIFFAVKKNAADIKPKAKPRRQDEYGTSVISLQFQKGGKNYLSIKNRYNHSVPNCDATFSNDLENIIAGLSESFELYFGFNLQGQNDFFLENYVIASDGKYYRYNYEIDNIYYCADNVLVGGNGYTKPWDKSRYILMDFWVLDLKEKTVFSYLGFQGKNLLTNEKIVSFDVKNGTQKGQRVITAKTESENTLKFVVNDKGQMIGYYDEAKVINKKAFFKNEYLECVSLPNVKEIGSYNFTHCPNLEKIYAPCVENIGRRCFENCKVQNLDFPKLVKIGGSCFVNVNELEALNAPNLEVLDENSFIYCRSLKNLSIPKIKDLNSFCFMTVPNLSEISFNNIETLGSHCFRGVNSVETIKMPNLIKTGQDCFLLAPNLQEVSLENLEEMGPGCFKRCKNIKKINLPKLEIMHGYCFYDSAEIETRYMPNIKKKAGMCFRKLNLKIQHANKKAKNKKSLRENYEIFNTQTQNF